jgi:hypothetical protein
LPELVEPSPPEPVVNCLPRREIVRKQTPGATAAQAVEDGVEDLHDRILARTPVGSLGRGARDEVSPFGIGEVGGIASAPHS